MPILTDLFYLPPIEYFVAIMGYKKVLVDMEGNYQKQTYRNRTQIRLTNKTETLSIPVKKGNSKIRYKEVEIDYDQKWKNVHLRGIQSSYGKAPFYEYYFPYLENIYQKNLTNLVSFNLELLTVCLKLLQLNVVIETKNPEEKLDDTVDIRGTIDSKQSFDTRSIYQAYPYHQLFGVDFVPNLSVIDLLFCAGPDSKEILINSRKNK